MGTANLFDLPEDVEAPPPLVEVEVEDDEPAVAEAAEAQPPELHVTEVEVEAGLVC